MEQAVNQFNKGLQLDTHPMVQGNDTLSDALNATFITMNGNEVVLQNDMGNRRIDNAFLPSGYQPLGMKEYGGVIYVAAYNPLTNRGQVGSFPSPQRKVNIDNPEGAINFNDFIIQEKDDNGNNIYYIDKEYIVVPISDKIVLHTGDKFSIYSGQIKSILDYLTQPNDIKNNLFTFQVGIFNSQNEFIDISNKLKLWNIKSLSNKKYKYFINDQFEDTTDTTIADSELLRARNRLAINTYSQKMSSPLYLKTIVNHINNISYSITGEITGNTTVNLEIEVTFYYNCIDSINNRHFEIYFNGNSYSVSEILEEPTYSQELEQYTAKYLYKINNLHVSNEEIQGLKKYKYEIKFPLLHNFNDWIEHYDPIYIKALNRSGELDLSKLDSDTLIFKGYRYYNDTSKEITTLIVNLESYPKKKDISKLHFCTILKDPQTNEIVLKEDEIINQFRPGTGTITKQFSYANLQKRKLYQFEFYYCNDLNKTPKDVKTGFYITTPIFNGNYIGEKDQSLEEYKLSGLINIENGNIHYSYDVMSNHYIDDFSKIQDILLSPILNSEVYSLQVENKTNTIGNYVCPLYIETNNAEYTLQETNKIKNIINVSASVENIEIYPSEVESLLEIKTTSDPIKAVERSINKDIMDKKGSSYKYSDGLKEIKNPEAVSDNDLDVIVISEETSHQNIEQNLQKIELISTINVNNNVNGSLEKKSIHCDHIISSFGDLIRRYYYGQNQMDYITLRPPYITIDWEGTSFVSIIASHNLEGLKLATDEPHRDALTSINGKIGGTNNNKDTYIDEVARDSISDFILSNCDGQLIVGEYSENDGVGGFLPCVYKEDENGSSTFYQIGSKCNGYYYSERTFKRLWLKINKKEYIPIFTNILKKEEKEEKFFKDSGVFGLVFSNIPHYYEYETGGKTLQEKIIDPNTMNKTIEFKVDSNVEIVITENVQLKAETPEYYQLISKYNTSQYSNNISEKISFKEGTISSNEEFIEDMENLSDYHINSAILYGDIDKHQLFVKDCEGKTIDPLYVYYNDFERNEDKGKGFKKSYIADKFYVPDLDIYMPELKSSRKLYGGEFGEHGLINEYVYPIKSKREEAFKNSHVDPLFIPYDLENRSDTDTINMLGTDKGLWDKTSIQWEGQNNRTYCQLPLRTRNIFNRNVILDFDLTTEGSNGESSMSKGWIDYDTYIRNLNNNP